MTIKEASEATTNWPQNSGFCTAIYYDTDTEEFYIGEYADWFSYTKFKGNVVELIRSDKKITIEDIAERMEELGL